MTLIERQVLLVNKEATMAKKQVVHQGYHTVTPNIVVNDAAKALGGFIPNGAQQTETLCLR